MCPVVRRGRRMHDASRANTMATVLTLRVRRRLRKWIIDLHNNESSHSALCCVMFIYVMREQIFDLITTVLESPLALSTTHVELASNPGDLSLISTCRCATCKSNGHRCPKGHSATR